MDCAGLAAGGGAGGGGLGGDGGGLDVGGGELDPPAIASPEPLAVVDESPPPQLANEVASITIATCFVRLSVMSSALPRFLVCF